MRACHAAHVQDLAGDGFFMTTVRTYRKKEWVARMMVPYIVLFSIASAASLAAVFVKGTFLVRKWWSRRLTGPGRQRQLSNVAGMQIGGRLQEGMASSSQQLEKAHALNAMFLDNKMERWQQYCALLTAVCEDIPMGTGSCHVCIAPTCNDGPVGSVCCQAP
jgi:hypothetical protein